MLIRNVATELITIGDIHRYAVSLFARSNLSYGHSTLTPTEDASFMIMHELHLPHFDNIFRWIHSKLLFSERENLLKKIHIRANLNIPSPYILNGCYQQGEYFFVDERVLIPRSYIGELLLSPNSTILSKDKDDLNSNSDMNHYKDLDYDDYFAEDSNQQSHVSGQNSKSTQLINKYNIKNVLDMCTGSACLAVLSVKAFPNIESVDAVDISRKALEVAKINIEMERPGISKLCSEIIKLHRGNLFDFLNSSQSTSDKRSNKYLYDLIISNPPYVSTNLLKQLPKEYRCEPIVALDGGTNGLKIINKIIENASEYLTEDGGLLLEIGRCKPQIEKSFPKLFAKENEGKGYTWINTQISSDEVVYITKNLLEKYVKNK
eukprot:gene12615-16915_t